MGFIGNFTTGTAGNYKIQISMLAGSDFDRRTLSTLWLFGTHGLFFKYPYLIFTTNTGNNQYECLLDGYIEKDYWYFEYNPSQLAPRVVTVIHDVSNQKIKFYVDSYLLGIVDCMDADHVPLPDFSGTYPLNTNSSYLPYSFDGTLGTPVFTANNTPPSVNTPRTPVYRSLVAPVGYIMGSGNWSGVDTIQQQYPDFQLPNWPAGIANSYATGRQIDLKRVVGYPGSGTITQQVIDDTIWLMDLLANFWGWVYNITDGYIFEFYEGKDDPLSICNQQIDWVLANPPATGVYEATTVVNGGYSIAPYTWKDFQSIVYTDPLSSINGNRQIYQLMMQALFAKAGDLPMRIFEDGEVLIDTTFNAAGQPQGTQKYADFYNYLRSLSDQVFSNTDSILYRIYDNRTFNLSGLQFVPLVSVNGKPTNSAPYAHTGGIGTIQQYILSPWNWRSLTGNNNGFEFYYVDKRYELGYGYPLNIPQIGLGAISTSYENQVLCAQGLALCVLLKVMGAKGFYANNYSLTDPRSYFYMLFVAPYVQSACNAYEAFLDSGVLLNGDTFSDTAQTVPAYVYWTGTKSVPCVARKLGTDRYMIGFAYMLLNNYDDQADTYDFTVTIDGITHDFSGARAARHCGDIYIYNSTTDTYTQITDFFETTHFQYWTSGSTPDTTPPVWNQAYGTADVVLACSNAAGLTTALAFAPTATDPDSPPATVVNTGNTGSIACGATYTRTWRATDALGNHTGTAPDFDFVQVIQILSAVDTTAPVIHNPAGSLNATLECNDADGLTLALSLFPNDVTDDFDPAPLLNEVSDTIVFGTGTLLYTRTRIWNYSDVSGNISSNFTQVITVQDTIAPTWTTVAGALDGTFLYTDTAGINAALAEVPSATDECAGVTVNPVSDSGPGIVPYTRIRTWEAVDDVGNISEIFTQTLFITALGMALEIKYGTSEICTDELTLHETTGIYDDPLNPGGYGNPPDNPNSVGLDYAWLFFPDSNFQVTTSDPIDITVQVGALGFPTDNWASTGIITPADVGLTEFPQGWYQIQFHFSTNADDYYINVDMYNNCQAVIDMATYNESITAKILAGTCNCNDGIPNSNCLLAFMYLQVQTLWAQEQFAQAMVMLKLLQDTLDNLLNTDC